MQGRDFTPKRLSVYQHIVGFRPPPNTGPYYLQGCAKERDAPDHGSIRVGGKASQGIPLAPQRVRARPRLSPTPCDLQGCAKGRDAPDHGSTRVGGKGSQGTKAFLCTEFRV